MSKVMTAAWRPERAVQLAREQASEKLKGFDAMVRRVQKTKAVEASPAKKEASR